MENTTNNYEKARPFLRWVGGKTWLVKHLPEIIDGKKFRAYHEPFLGGGAVFFATAPYEKSYLSDLNEELISTYIAVRDDVNSVVDILQGFSNNKESYYQVRSLNDGDLAYRAARFIYLNNTSFNGIYRVNLKGVYNVPYGYRDTPFYNTDKLVLVSNVLANAELSTGDFFSGLEKIDKEDLVFLDPPYAVSHNDNGFIKYNQKLFSLEDQERLSQLIDCIKEKEAYYLLTNAAHEKIRKLFTKKGDRILEKQRASLIGGAKAVRGPVKELVFTNIGAK